MPDRLTNEQRVWDCRWAKLANDRARRPQDAGHESPWLCERETGAPRPVTEQECARCAFWELDPLVR